MIEKQTIQWFNPKIVCFFDDFSFQVLDSDNIFETFDGANIFYVG